ncbi:MAG TPA: NADH-quinone oxidoreductase subunit NuoG [Candidatus Competibacteraceae bacterium]|nr:MAG: NADH-quinone oxidoreductase subunit G [Candidatus Competibacteraceae bacterium]HOB62003.1 NADH-quinone oxidoreductase subunit NuoG [Candidatus Competibacteraceae bacterium]HQA27406.1 NADH-quinone oxidoreductase subunit NuoG [Candidatus Competibacteraceae bacterium]HQD55275.1 NADH-quinone oxidoreductase subunit NuoG [Candidatus Competibacteraceae bacterium]
MSEEQVNIEVNGIPLKARKGAMLIEVTDAAGIPIPRFCYHKKLSIAASCRMCLVEVEKAPKAMPACATPVMEGMKVHTESPKALAAQKGTMEFLLINHPLDCPICDQGGECELQDLAVGYGGDVSRFAERKRVVKEKDIGPLIATDMTRCIHCTRCVRFGDEIAGLRELGATGRGENMEIGTYVAHSIVSELSGNVIDLCPVGALTAKPSRYRGRSWEYVQHPAVAPHDSVGSNVFVHTLRGKVMRVAPRENEQVNETWLSDRDRFSYEGIYSDDRLGKPLLGGTEAEWGPALEAAAKGLKDIIARHGADAVGFLVSPTATVEELYLAQKLARGLGIANIDHRLRQADFSDQAAAPVFPWLGQAIEDLEKIQAALLIGSNVRMEQPLAGHRLRKAALAGGKVMFINPRDFEFRFPVAAKAIASPIGMVTALAGVALAVAELKGLLLPDNLYGLGTGVPTEVERAMAANLVNAAPAATVLLGNLAVAHPVFAQLRALAGFIAQHSGARLGYLPEAADSAGGWLAGALPHRVAGGRAASAVGLNAQAMLESPRKAYVLLGVEPELDCWDGAVALKALQGAELIVSLSPYAALAGKTKAQVILPVATFAETSGTYINAEGRWQSFQGATKPFGEARPAWKVLRVLGNLCGLDGFEYVSSDEILAEVQAACSSVSPDNTVTADQSLVPLRADGLLRVAEVPIYAADALVRRARSLQASSLARPAEVRLHPDAAQELGVAGREQVQVRQNGMAVDLPLVLDESIPRDCAWIPAGLGASVAVGPAVGPVAIQ